MTTKFTEEDIALLDMFASRVIMRANKKPMSFYQWCRWFFGLPYLSKHPDTQALAKIAYNAAIDMLNTRNLLINQNYMDSSGDTCGSTKHNSACLLKAADDEPIFVLRANDPTAPEVVATWIQLNEQIQPEHKLNGAVSIIKEMHDWRTKKNEK